MFLLDCTVPRCFRYISLKTACLFLAFHHWYSLVPLYHYMLKVPCHPPNLRAALQFVYKAHGVVSALLGLLLLTAVFGKKNRTWMIMAYLVMQHLSILYSVVAGLLVCGTHWDGTRGCHELPYLALSCLLLVIWQIYVYICLNSYRVLLKLPKEEKETEAGLEQLQTSSEDSPKSNGDDKLKEKSKGNQEPKSKHKSKEDRSDIPHQRQRDDSKPSKKGKSKDKSSKKSKDNK